MIAPALRVFSAAPFAQTSAGDTASSQVSMAIVGFVVLAAVIAVVTVVFWRLTRPEVSGPRRRVIRADQDPAEGTPGSDTVLDDGASTGGG